MTDIASQKFARQDGRGRQATSPTAIPFPGWKDILWRLYRSINNDRVMLTAAGVTYYVLLALVPTLTAFVSIYGLFNTRSSVVDQVNLLAGIVPTGGLEIIRDQLTRITSESDGTLGVTLLVSLAIALWSASAGVKAMFEGMNIAYHETEKRSFIRVNLLALGFTLGGAIAGVLVLGVVLAMPPLLALLPGGEGLEWAVRIASYIVMLGVVMLGIGALYRWGPSRQEAKWRWITPGAIMAVVAAVATSLLFSWYVANFSDYNATYGSLGALIGLLTWIWLTATLVIIGAELNSEVEHQTARDSTTGAEQPLGERGAAMADSVGRVWPPDRKKMEGATEPAPQSRRSGDGAWVLALGVAALLALANRRQDGNTRK
ncbi:YihY/virulence factor BrkB family protein [uncultured Devosia sp.]|uniref:YihY/virulence factor BrkB family protein n=1 Tax=uncultured Devosia sp. TaxID=211434 RepID=UPI0035C9C315